MAKAVSELTSKVRHEPAGRLTQQPGRLVRRDRVLGLSPSRKPVSTASESRARLEGPQAWRRPARLMARASTPQEEDRRRVCRDRRTVRHVNRIKGLLFAQGVRGYEPLRSVGVSGTAERRPLPVHLT
jgi:hypothetical protein